MLTVVIPVMNRVDYFEETVKSVLAQTVPCNIIVVDNNSDTSFFREKCERLSVKYYKFDERVAMFKNWNRAIGLVETEYVMVLGDDDILSPNYVEHFEEVVTKEKSIDVYFSNFDFLYSNGKTKISNCSGIWGYNTGQSISTYAALNGLNFPTIAMAVRTTHIKKYKYYDLSHGSSDYLWIYSKFNQDVNFFGDNRSLVKYRKHEKADTSSNYYRNMVFYLMCYENIYNFATDNFVKREALSKLNSLIVKLFFCELYSLQTVISNITNDEEMNEVNYPITFSSFECLARFKVIGLLASSYHQVKKKSKHLLQRIKFKILR